MTFSKAISRLAALMWAGVAAGGAQAIDLWPDSAFVHAGAAPRGVQALSAGVAWDWDWERTSGRLQLKGQTELFASRWRARDFGNGHQNFHQVVILPVLRIQGGQGGSPWFAEAGIGVSWMDRLYITPSQANSTHFNFYDMLGVGYQFGDRRRHELGLRLVHISNAGLKKPNPGEEFLQLRYAARF